MHRAKVSNNTILCNMPIVLLSTPMAIQRCGRDYCDAKMVMSAADAMATNGMKDAGYEYIIISGERFLTIFHPWIIHVTMIIVSNCLYMAVQDCWADHRTSDGTIVADKDRFPE